MTPNADRDAASAGPATLALPARCALVVVDAQLGFEHPRWGRRNNPACDDNIAALVGAFTASSHDVVLVRHDSRDPAGTLHPDAPGNAFKPYLDASTADLVVSKQVNSAFHGTPDLHAWLGQRGVTGIVVSGITTNHCCETTARVGGNLGHDVWFALDATHTFDRSGPDGTVMTADELARATATNLHGEFATVVTTAEVCTALGAPVP